MKLSKLYSNLPAEFKAVAFADGLNVVLAEIRLPENRNRDTHNLGKSVLGQMLDFTLLQERDPKLFLFKHFDKFGKFVFYLEIKLDGGEYFTIRRSVDNASRIAFKRHVEKDQDYSPDSNSTWDHFDVPFERARELLDGVLDLQAIKPWQFRKNLGYLLRSQDDYQDVFQIGKYASKHRDWKPFLAHLLGFDSKSIGDHYDVAQELAEKKADVERINSELGGTVNDVSKIEGVLLLKQKEAAKKQSSLDSFDFRSYDKQQAKDVVDDIDNRIAELNQQRYSLRYSRRRISDSLRGEQVLFDPGEASRLFLEAGIVFDGQIKKDFEQLVAFNKAITEERRQYLEEELIEVESQIKECDKLLNTLGKRRSDALAPLSTTDIFAKYKQVADELVTLRADITSLERQRGHLYRLQEMRSEVRRLAEETQRLQLLVEADIEKQNADGNSLFSEIRVFFSDIVQDVIDRKALLSVFPNSLGYPEFRAEILDESGNATSADAGHTYKKLLCMAFDLAVLRAHLNVNFPRFVYHDGALESLDDRKKVNLIAVIREYAALGLQPIITMIDSDLPGGAGNIGTFAEDEIVLRLNDEGDEGRLFMMSAW